MKNSMPSPRSRLSLPPMLKEKLVEKLALCLHGLLVVHPAGAVVLETLCEVDRVAGGRGVREVLELRAIEVGRDGEVVAERERSVGMMDDRREAGEENEDDVVVATWIRHGCSLSLVSGDQKRS
jgi:hypothetical protein